MNKWLITKLEDRKYCYTDPYQAKYHGNFTEINDIQRDQTYINQKNINT
jgi:hypothetical protein